MPEIEIDGKIELTLEDKLRHILTDIVEEIEALKGYKPANISVMHIQHIKKMICGL